MGFSFSSINSSNVSDFLGVVFLIYGSVKIVFGQFGEPTPEALALNGEGFVMAWRFFGYSKEYEIVIGIGEVVAAILIMIRARRCLEQSVIFQSL